MRTVPAQVGSAFLLGLFWQQVGWLAHDVLHHQVFRNRWANNWAGLFFGNISQVLIIMARPSPAVSGQTKVLAGAELHQPVYQACAGSRRCLPQPGHARSHRSLILHRTGF